MAVCNYGIPKIRTLERSAYRFMERNYGEEIDALREQVENLRNMIASPSQIDDLRAMVMELLPEKPSAEKLKRVHVMHGMHVDKCLSEHMEKLCYKAEEKGTSGLVTYLGVYASGGRQSNWIRSGVLTDDLLALIESGIASKVLACIGNSNRLAILLEILKGPKTVASLVEKCGFGSTGQVYHHMKPLLAADIIVEDEHQKGAYVIQPHKVQGVIMLLAGISDMVDETYTKGTWEADGENLEDEKN